MVRTVCQKKDHTTSEQLNRHRLYDSKTERCLIYQYTDSERHITAVRMREVSSIRVVDSDAIIIARDAHVVVEYWSQWNSPVIVSLCGGHRIIIRSNVVG